MNFTKKRETVEKYLNKKDNIIIGKLSRLQINTLFPIAITQEIIENYRNTQSKLYEGIKVCVTTKCRVSTEYFEKTNSYNCNFSPMWGCFTIDKQTTQRILFPEKEIGKKYTLNSDGTVGRCYENNIPFGDVIDIEKDVNGTYLAHIRITITELDYFKYLAKEAEK